MLYEQREAHGRPPLADKARQFALFDRGAAGQKASLCKDCLVLIELSLSLTDRTLKVRRPIHAVKARTGQNDTRKVTVSQNLLRIGREQMIRIILSLCVVQHLQGKGLSHVLCLRKQDVFIFFFFASAGVKRKRLLLEGVEPHLACFEQCGLAA